MNIKNIIPILLVIILLPLVSANLIPTNAPCWYTGTVTDGDIAAEGLTIEAYKGNTLLKSSVISGGIYNLNSVGANDGDLIQLKVDGATFVNSTFVGYCKTGNDPWVVKDFTISKQANGVSCSDDAICISGVCSNNVCSSSSSSGHHHTNTNTTNTNTTSDSSSSNGGGSPSNNGGNSSNTGGGNLITNPIVVLVPDINTSVKKNDLISSVVKALGVNTTQVKSIEEESVKNLTSKLTLTKKQIEDKLSNHVPVKVLTAVKSQLNKYKSVQVRVNTKSRVMKVTKSNGKVVKVTKIEKEIIIDNSNFKGKTIRIIQVIPKDVAMSASNIAGNFIVLENDPVLAFDVPVTSVNNGKVKLDYTVSGDKSNSSLENIETSVVDKNEVVVVDNTKPTPKVVDETTKPVPNTQEVTPTKSNTSSIIFITILIILVIVGIGSILLFV